MSARLKKQKVIKGLIVLVVIGVLVSLGWGSWQIEKKEKENKKVKPEILKESEGLNYKDMLEQMFPTKEFDELKEKYFEDNEGNIFYIERVLEDSFIQPNEKNLLLIVRQESPLAHASGFYHAYLAIFDNKTKQVLTDTLALSAGDTGNINFFRANNGQVYILFNSTVTYQGWTDCGIELFFVKNHTFKKALWPIGGFGDSCFKIKGDKITVLKREILGRRGESLIPDYRWVDDYNLYWNPQTAKFELKIKNWKSFQNKEYGYEIRYPEGSTLKERGRYSYQTGPSPKELFTIIYDSSVELTHKYGKVIIDVLPKEMGKYLKHIVTIGTVEEISERKIIVAGIEGILIHVKEGAKVWGEAKDIIEEEEGALIFDRSENGLSQIWLKRNQRLYVIKGAGFIFDQIFPTFRFLE